MLFIHIDQTKGNVAKRKSKFTGKNTCDTLFADQYNHFYKTMDFRLDEAFYFLRQNKL